MRFEWDQYNCWEEDPNVKYIGSVLVLWAPLGFYHCLFMSRQLWVSSGFVSCYQSTRVGIYLLSYVRSVTVVVASPTLLAVVLSTAAQHRQQLGEGRMLFPPRQHQRCVCRALQGAGAESWFPMQPLNFAGFSFLAELKRAT